ncbi:MAG: leucine-rich repeat domain-containing protein [Verrucomicrobia bacterium]|nr:leucine-rich repeat domain-containing protein [Verrucomicrobiota bacterium]
MLLPYLSLPACGDQEGDFEFQRENEGAVITRYHGLGGAVVIPERLGDIPVTGIGLEAFYGVISLTNVTIPDSVTSIGYYAFALCTNLTSFTMHGGVSDIGGYAFQECSSLTNVAIPNSVTAVGEYAFYGCGSLTTITIGTGVTYIGFRAFSDCTSLTSIVVDALNSSYSSIGGVLFNKAQNVIVAYPGGKAGAYAIPNSVTTTGVESFYGCTSLTSVTIPNSVKLIEPATFSGCTGLTTVAIPIGAISIGDYAFAECTGLTSVVIPNSVISIGDYAFWNCIRLPSVAIGTGVTSIGNSAFRDCVSLTNVTIGSGVTYIGTATFSGCIRLPSVIIPNSVRSLLQGAFSICTSLTSIYFEGDAPSLNIDPFESSPFITIFYRSDTTGWEPNYGGRPTAVWTTLSGYDIWAVTTGLTTLFPDSQGESDDPDIDGFTNRSEWLAGTDPTQSASHLELEFTPRPADLSDSDKIPVPVDRHAVYFRSIPGRYYGVQRAMVLGGEWELQAVRVASTSQTRLVLWSPDSQVYYRVIVLP